MVGRVVPFAACRDRPRPAGSPEGGASSSGGLAGHLRSVGRFAEDLAADLGVPPARRRLLRLAALLHDAGKARSEWQRYVHDGARRRGSVPHAYWGAAVFFALGWEWCRARDAAAVSADLVEALVRLARDVADHHGRLGDLEPRPPWWSRWQGAPADLDLAGLAALVEEELPEFAAPWLRDADAVAARVEAADHAWRGAVVRCRGAGGPFCLVRSETACLVAADRFAVAGLQPSVLEAGETVAAAEAVARHALERRAALRGQGAAAAALAEIRSAVQTEALAHFRARPNEPIYELVLPTGSGKTMAALGVALEAVRRGGRRVVYVAPYLSVLSQAARAIAEATGLPVLEHHHLSLPTPGEAAGDEVEGDDERAFLAMTSWQAPIVATTFNQLFAALFPRTAQQTLRLPALRGAVVIVDEPQIIDGAAWPLFCAAVEALAAALEGQFLLVSATMPPWQGQRPPVALTPDASLPSRYVLHVEPAPWDAATAAAAGLDEARARGSASVILNTIADAVEVYRAAAERAGDTICLLVHGAMTGLHKAAQIRRARALVRRAPRAGRPVLLVSTQVLEAGVDLSLRALLRARPVLPSVVQAAGRVNRHAEGPPAPVTVFPFVRRREGGGAPVDTRSWVYRDPLAREESDAALARLGREAEEEVLRACVRDYYGRLLTRVPAGLGVAERLDEVARGRWSAVAGTAPFGPEPPGLEVFVPRDDWNDRLTRRLLRFFGLRGAADIPELHGDTQFRRSLRQVRARRWSALVHRFTVPVPFAQACAAVRSLDEPGIFPLADPADYSAEVGMADILPTHGDEAIYL